MRTRILMEKLKRIESDVSRSAEASTSVNCIVSFGASGYVAALK